MLAAKMGGERRAETIREVGLILSEVRDDVKEIKAHVAAVNGTVQKHETRLAVTENRVALLTKVFLGIFGGGGVSGAAFGIYRLLGG